jgi:ASC-1-like (ASCH) protein
MQQQLRLFNGLTRFVMRNTRAEIIELERQMNEVADRVDAFYERLGSRHWTFNDWMSVTAIDAILNETSTPEEAEARLIKMYQDTNATKRDLLRLRTVDGLHERHHLLVRAREDYDAGRFDTCAMLLIVIMDGFVNDFQPDQRKGLAARDADEMVAWDSVTGHHLGLTNALKPFLKTIKKRVDDEVFEVHRHGIVHGSVTNFNNAVVATKAWNLLFAVVDWSIATTKKAKEDEKPPEPGWRETFSSVAEYSRKMKAQKQFVPSTVVGKQDEFEKDEVVAQTRLFIDAWQKQQWGGIVPLMPFLMISGKRPGEAAEYAKSWFDAHQIAAIEIDRVEYTQSSVAEIRGTATIDGISGKLRLRWVYHDAQGNSALNGEPGSWHLAIVAPHTYLVDDDGKRLN